MPSFASQLRTNSTDAEKRLWYFLRNRQLAGFKFRRQFPISPYIADFVCLEQRLIIELDGGQHADAMVYDNARTVFLEQQGFRLLRFWNNEMLGNTEAVRHEILRALALTSDQARQA